MILKFLRLLKIVRVAVRYGLDGHMIDFGKHRKMIGLSVP